MPITKTAQERISNTLFQLVNDPDTKVGQKEKFITFALESETDWGKILFTPVPDEAAYLEVLKSIIIFTINNIKDITNQQIPLVKVIKKALSTRLNMMIDDQKVPIDKKIKESLDAIDPKGETGQIFYLQRGDFEPNLNLGTLNEIKQIIENKLILQVVELNDLTDLKNEIEKIKQQPSFDSAGFDALINKINLLIWDMQKPVDLGINGIALHTVKGTKFISDSNYAIDNTTIQEHSKIAAATYSRFTKM